MWPFKPKAGGKAARAQGQLADPEKCAHPYAARVSEYREVQGERVFTGYHCEVCGTFSPVKEEVGAG